MSYMRQLANWLGGTPTPNQKLHCSNSFLVRFELSLTIWFWPYSVWSPSLPLPNLEMMGGETEAPSAGGARQLLQNLAQSTPSWWPMKPMEVKRWARYATGTWEAAESRGKSHLQQMHAVPKPEHCSLRPLEQFVLPNHTMACLKSSLCPC